MKFLIATGIYPPDLGGPARYAKELTEALKAKGHQVKVLPYRLERKLPFGIRQLWYLGRLILQGYSCDYVIALDTVSVGFPAVAMSFALGKKVAIRTGGDFLWEAWLERTGMEIPLPAFYKIMPELAYKERLIQKIHQFILDYTDYVVFSTKWQCDIWSGFYNVEPEKVRIIENCYYEKRPANVPSKKIFMGSARDIVMKNLDNVREAFELAKKSIPEIELDLNQYPPNVYDEKLKDSYAFILASLGDISPNSIIEAISYNKPFILTKYNGISERLGGAGLIVDPINTKQVAGAIIKLCDPKSYKTEQEKVSHISFVHTYADIAEEFLKLFSK
jgi:glycosyltransferase involved in cell wall biosynthesis